MRIAAFGLSLAPLALLSAVGLQSNAYLAYPTVGYTEPMTCAAAGDNRMLRATLGYPIQATSRGQSAWSLAPNQSPAPSATIES